MKISVIILSAACIITLCGAIFFCKRMQRLQKKINAIKKITEDFEKELETPSVECDRDPFYSLIEPVLRSAGCTYHYLAEGQFLVHNEDIHFTIKHYKDSRNPIFERVQFESRFKDVRAEDLFPEGVLLITNRLSGVYPDFNVVCSKDGRVRICYRCDIVKSEDILPHVMYASAFFRKIQFEAKQIIEGMQKSSQPITTLK